MGTHKCPVNGGWSAWSQYTKCSRTCGTGYQYLKRTCNNPAPAHGGKKCSGSWYTYVKCNTQLCKINGGWTGWIKSGSCSKSCGSGTQKYYRTCTNPKPANGGAKCSGATTTTASCNTHKCPVNGGWSAWSQYTKCSKTCATGYQYLKRTCNNPAPANGGKNCAGSWYIYTKCNTQACKVNGGWSSYSEYTKCSKTCGTGYQYLKRTCNNPAPKNGGANCAGSWYTYVKCNTKACVTKVNGGWSSWVDYTKCSKTCGTGYHYKKRTCNNPAPKNGGANCPGSWYTYVSCNTKSCGSTINFGQSVTNRGALDEWSNAMYIWELHRSISHSGTIKQWKFYARRTGQIYLQVFRKYSGCYYKIIGQTIVNVRRTGSNTVNANIAVKKGDYLGFYFPGSSIIPFDGHECTSQRTYYVRSPSKSSIQVNRYFYFRQKQYGWKPCRKYSQTAVIAVSG